MTARSLLLAAVGLLLCAGALCLLAVAARPALATGPSRGEGLSGRVIVEPRQGERPVIKALDAAQHAVFVEAYILTDRSIVRALERAASQSVAVRVLLEPRPLGMGRQPETVADELRAAGAAVRWASPAFALTHSKFLMIDDRRALISTANFSRAGFSSDRDFMIWDRSSRDVYALDTLFRADWNRRPARVDAPNLLVAPLNARGGLLRLISRARHSIELYGEEMRDPGIERALARVACAGVRVRVLLPVAPETRSPVYQHGCVRIRTLMSPYIHAKALVVDGNRGFLGSENVSSQSLDRNREIGVLTRGDAARQVRASFERDWARALPVRASES